MKRHETSNTTWTITTKVPLGKQCFKFVVDGQWCVSDKCETVTDESGMVNNVVEVAEETTSKDREPESKIEGNGVHAELKQDEKKKKKEEKGGMCSVM